MGGLRHFSDSEDRYGVSVDIEHSDVTVSIYFFATQATLRITFFLSDLYW